MTNRQQRHWIRLEGPREAVDAALDDIRERLPVVRESVDLEPDGEQERVAEIIVHPSRDASHDIMTIAAYHADVRLRWATASPRQGGFHAYKEQDLRPGVERELLVHHLLLLALERALDSTRDIIGITEMQRRGDATPLLQQAAADSQALRARLQAKRQAIADAYPHPVPAWWASPVEVRDKGGAPAWFGSRAGRVPGVRRLS